LFTRLQVPAGKAIALAAMPTAVLMGMGLTPTLAQAKGMPKNPFQDGPCVTQPDESPAASGKTDKSNKADGKKDQANQQKSDAKDGGDTVKPSASAAPKPSSSSKAPSPKASSSGGESKASRTPAPSPSASRSGSGGLLGDLGGVLGGILSPDQKGSAQPEPSASASSGSGAAAKSGSGTAEDSGAGTAKGSGSAVDKVTGTVGKVTGGVGDALGKAGDKAKDATKPSPSASDPMAADANGKKPFPCVVEKKASGTDETPPAMIPNEPWELQASSLLLQGLDYQGVVNLTMPNGETKQALKFTADNGVDIGDLHQIVAGPDGKQYHVQAAKGSTSTIRGGRVTMYTQSLSGNLFGLIPITFDPEHPPPVNLPVAYFTHVKIIQAGQFGGNLTVPGLHQFITG
jgi:hypothetical protein